MHGNHQIKSPVLTCLVRLGKNLSWLKALAQMRDIAGNQDPGFLVSASPIDECGRLDQFKVAASSALAVDLAGTGAFAEISSATIIDRAFTKI